MTLRKTLLSTLLLSFTIAGNVYAEITLEEFDRALLFRLGDMHYNGQGVNQDYYQAAKWYQKAAELGDAKAQGMLGIMYYKGQGVRQNFTTAKMWFGKACDNGAQEACDIYRKLNEIK